MKHEMPELPYGMNDLAPYMSQETLEYHYGKHLKTYVTNLNNLTKGTKFEDMTQEEIIKTAEGSIFNNAAQAWNHTFFFHSLTPRQGNMPEKLLTRIAADFGSAEKLKEDFTKAAAGIFGSGWCWLVQNGDEKLQIVTTSNAGCPITEGLRPIAVIDVWEHAYYIDYRNNRAGFIEAVWNLLDWGKICGRLI